MHEPLGAIIYDAGFTLIEPRLRDDVAIAHACNQGGFAVSPADIHRNLPHFGSFMADFEQHTPGIFGDAAALEGFWRALYSGTVSQTARSLGVRLPAGVPLAIANDVIRSYETPGFWQLYDDVIPTLDRARELGLRQGVISDWGPALPDILHGLGITEHLDFLVVSATIGAAKPNTLLWDLAISRSGVAAERSAFVGDTYRNDVLGARAVGMRPVLLDRACSGVRADCPVVCSLRDLFPALGM